MNQDFDADIEFEEASLSQEDDRNDVPPSDIVAYNELRSCADLYRMYVNGQLVIQPDFQRDIIWPKPAQTRFLDSLIKQLPIPSMCISLDYRTQERLVIDGLQRISTIVAFLSSNEWRLSSLVDIDSRISGKTNTFIRERMSELYERVENLTIPVTVLRCDYSKKSHMQYLFTIFHRLNTGGNKLNNQEIRNCIFYGSFNNFLKEAISYNNFILLFNILPNRTYRFQYEELILRFIAFYVEYEEYNGKLASYLSEFMNENKEANSTILSRWMNIFQRTIDIIYFRILQGTVIPNISKATTESLFVGIARNLEYIENQDDEHIIGLYVDLRNDPLFSLESLKEGLSKKDRVLARITRSVQIFSL